MSGNIIDIFKKELKLNNKFADLYKNFENEDLTIILSTLHFELTALFEIMNEKLPTGNFYGYYPAEPSRKLISTIEKIEKLEISLKNTNFSFELDSYYLKLVKYCKKILKPKAGSTIQRNTEKITIYFDKPIFVKK